MEVEESLLSASRPADNLDSLAVAPAQGWVVGTTKETHQLLVLDAGDGSEVRRVGREGAGLGEFRRPNGIAIVDDLVLVVERDNARLQVLRLPNFDPVGAVGEQELRRPYGIAVHRLEGGVYDLYLTDQFEVGGLADGGDPALTGRVKQYRLETGVEHLRSRLIRSIGDPEGSGALLKVETIAVDPELDRLLVADEHSSRINVKIYTLDGRFTGTTVGDGVLTSEPEGIALWACGARGVWVVTDQHARRTLFHLFDRVTLEHLGAFSGAVTANTDGIALAQAPLAGFPDGALFAVDDDRRMAAFDWRRVASALGLEADCPLAD
jgi:3-phytase